MSSRYEYSQVSGTAELTNSQASSTLVENPGSTVYLYVESLAISVWRAAVGGGGIVRVQDTNGNSVFTVSGDGVKDVGLDFGSEGLRLGPGVGLQAVTANAQGEQASASVAMSGHLAFR